MATNKSVIIECNQNNADYVYQNGHYISSFANSIPIFTGDTISARQCSIDSQLSESNTIIIAQDLAASIVFSYYDCDYDFQAMKHNFTGGAWTTTYQYYAGYGQIQIVQLDTCRVSLAGLGNGSFYAKCWFSWVNAAGQVVSDNINIGNNGNSYGGFIIYDPDLYPGQNDWIDCEPNYVDNPNTPIQYQNGTLILTKLVINSLVYDPKYYEPGFNVTHNIGAPVSDLLLGHLNISIPAGRYDPTEIAELITEQIGSSQGVNPVPDGANQIFTPANPALVCIQQPTGQELLFCQITNAPPLFDNTAYKYIPDGTTGQYPYLFVGADLMAIQYNITGPIFQWSYGYTPFFNTASPNTKNVVLYSDGNPALGKLRYFLLTTATGITIHDLQPASFWQQIGLYDAMITKLQQTPGGTSYYTYNAWNVPEEGTALGFFTPGYNRNPTPPSNTQPQYFVTDAIANNSVLGNEINSNTTGGYYLVQGILNNGTTSYYDNVNVYDNIVSIVSTQYNTANTITAFGDSAVPWVNTGAPFNLSSIQINILDALSKTTSPQLGANNTVIFEVTRASQNITVIDASGQLTEVPVLDIL